MAFIPRSDKAMLIDFVKFKGTVPALRKSAPDQLAIFHLPVAELLESCPLMRGRFSDGVQKANLMSSHHNRATLSI